MSRRPASGPPSSSSLRPSSPLTLGWREWVALPGLGVSRIKAKLDTGARTSALHVGRIRRFERDGRAMVGFRVFPGQRDDVTWVDSEAEWIEDRRIRSSSGEESVRPVVVTDLEVAGRRWPIEVTLARRDAMGFRLLLGRQAMKGRIVVDPGASFLAGGRAGSGGKGGVEGNDGVEGHPGFERHDGEGGRDR